MTRHSLIANHLGWLLIEKWKVGMYNAYMHEHMQRIAPVLHPQLPYHHLGQNALVGSFIRARPSRIWKPS